MPAKPTQREIKELIKIYLEARERLYNTILHSKGATTRAYANTILKQLEAEIKQLKKQSLWFIRTAVPREYRTGLKQMERELKRLGVSTTVPEVFATLHTDSIYMLMREMEYNIESGLAEIGRRTTQYVNVALDETLRTTSLRQLAIKEASGGTIQDMRKALLEEFQEKGFLTVQYGNGKNARQVPIDAYASMVARTITLEAGNLSRKNQLTSNGYDLVFLSEHYPTCDKCAPLQRRVYSISGKDTRFPPLSRAFGEYNIIHPNCLHICAPWIERLHTQEEIEQAIAFSNRPFEDNRSQEERDLYDKQQDQNRRVRQELYQYERYRQVLGDDAPKSQLAFRRLKEKGGEEWEDLQYYYRYKGDRPTYCVKIDRELLKAGINKGKAFPADHDFQIQGWQPHALNRMKEAGASAGEVKAWQQEAKVMFKRYPEPNTLLSYYSNDGIIGIREADGIVRTAIEKARFRNDTETILEVIRKHVGND